CIRGERSDQFHVLDAAGQTSGRHFEGNANEEDVAWQSGGREGLTPDIIDRVERGGCGRCRRIEGDERVRHGYGDIRRHRTGLGNDDGLTGDVHVDDLIIRQVFGDTVADKPDVAPAGSGLE